MAKKAFFLTEEDANILKAVIKRERDLIVNTRGKHSPEPDNGPAPDTYVALVPGGGMTARVGTTPGQADCDVYRITSGSLTQIASLANKTVYNLSSSTIAASGYIVITKTKGGAWISATDPSSSSSLTVEEVGGATLVSGVTLLIFDQVDGFVVSPLGTGSTGTGTARVDMLPASPAQAGNVSIANQILGSGVKSVVDGFLIGNSNYSLISSGGLIAVVKGSNALLTSMAMYGRLSFISGNVTTGDVTEEGSIGAGYSSYVSGDISLVSRVPGKLLQIAVRSNFNSIRLSGNNASLPQIELESTGGSGLVTGTTSTQAVGQRCVFRSGICIGFI